jgi:hypothetical protein
MDDFVAKPLFKSELRRSLEACRGAKTAREPELKA